MLVDKDYIWGYRAEERNLLEIYENYIGKIIGLIKVLCKAISALYRGISVYKHYIGFGVYSLLFLVASEGPLGGSYLEMRRG